MSELRKPIVVMNWAMRQNKNQDAIQFSRELVEILKNSNQVEKVILPSMGTIHSVAEVTKETNIKVGAQNIAPIEHGEMSGEYSIESLIDIKGEFVEIGHWERRLIFGETEELINKKLLLTLNNNLTPILCVGEKEKTDDLEEVLSEIERQLYNNLYQVKSEELENIVIAYTPYWTVGQTYASNYPHVHEVVKGIRSRLNKYFNSSDIEKLRIIYGGSVSPENTKLIIDNEDIDGVLVGRFGSEPSRYAEIVKIIESNK
ncbi:triose-phosphate isomerase family protein [Vagococcus carniphilus]